MKKGFSLAEVMVAMIIVTIVLLLTIPTLAHKFSTTNNTAYKALMSSNATTAYGGISQMQQLINEIMANATMLIDTNGNLTNNATTNMAHSYAGNYTYRFCNEFMSKLNIISNATIPSDCTITTVAQNCTIAPPTVDSINLHTPNFITTNGVAWYGFEQDFCSTGNMTIYVDVNGINQGPNLMGQDVLGITIDNNGSVEQPAPASNEYNCLNGQG